MPRTVPENNKCCVFAVIFRMMIVSHYHVDMRCFAICTCNFLFIKLQNEEDRYFHYRGGVNAAWGGCRDAELGFPCKTQLRPQGMLGRVLRVHRCLSNCH